MLGLKIETECLINGVGQDVINRAYDDLMTLSKRLDVCVSCKLNDKKVSILPSYNREKVRLAAIINGWPVPEWGE